MANRYTRLAGVAAVVLVVVSFLFPGRNGIVAESVAWADVQKAVEKALEQTQNARVTGTRNCFFSQDETPTYKLGVEKLFSLSYGYVDRTFTADGRLIIEFDYDLPTGTVTVLFPTYKRYYRMQVPPEFRERAKQLTPEKFLEWFWSAGAYRKIDPKEIQGVQAAGFEIPDVVERFTGGLGLNAKLVSFFLSLGPSNTRIWVNPKTRLPLQVECEGKANPCLLTGYREMRLHEIDDQWKFEVELDGAQFLPAIPADYQALTLPFASRAEASLYLAGAGAMAPILLAVRRSRRRRSRTPVTAP